ncbi:MAG TPA: L-threonylcarbamoyladenylate synthase [Polyangiaceae bacterium]|nr:L-threonylcarbamoyladenylate synthase [Polyangiaceae bacterium]
MSSNPDLERAVLALRQGKLVAFPTETVYGLGADAENAAAVGRIFAVKGRPSNHPLIVHVADAGALERWAARVPDAARRLAEACWPGPLTLLLEKSPRVPDATTGGLPSVGLRVPAHPLALELLKQFGGGVAAPSANRFGRVSPTSAAHVREDLGDDVDVLLDGGSCSVGVESTILDLTHDVPVLLRPGGITAERIESLLGVSITRHAAADVRAPGMLASHYAPRALVEIASGAELVRRARDLAERGERVAVLLSGADDRKALVAVPGVALLDLGADDSAAAQRLYAALRQADVDGASIILASRPVAHGLGEALADRLTKAAGPRHR